MNAQPRPLPGEPTVVWLQGSGCTGCSVSALGVTTPHTIDDILTNVVSLKYHTNLMALDGRRAMSVLNEVLDWDTGDFILVVEGGIPTAENGKYCVIGEWQGSPMTMLGAFRMLAPAANRIIAVGSCACGKGVATQGDNETGIMPVADLVDEDQRDKVVNVPGCPASAEKVFEAITGELTCTK